MRALLVWLALTCSSCLVRDWNEDGTIRIAVVGDSNTLPRTDGPSWCGQLTTAHQTIDWRCFAKAGLAASEALPYIDTAIATQPDLLLIALGTNDIWRGASGSEVAERLQSLTAYAENLGVTVLVATVPRMFYFGPPVNDRIADTNARLRLWRGALLDFDSDLIEEDYFSDGIHFVAAGQAKRTQRAEDLLW
jgi:lysophospholipase L1-like esterase